MIARKLDYRVEEREIVRGAYETTEESDDWTFVIAIEAGPRFIVVFKRKVDENETPA